MVHRCSVSSPTKFTVFPEVYSLYFEVSFSEDFLRLRNRHVKAIMRVGINFDSDWKALTNTELIGELDYENEDVEKERWKIWCNNYKHRGQHPADFKNTGFVLPSEISSKDIVGCGWNSSAGEMYLTKNGKIIESKRLIHFGKM